MNWQEGAFEIHWRATEAFTTGQVEAIHGGAIATLLDNAMGWATNTVLQDDENFATADLQIQFVRAAKIGLLKARGSVVRRTRAQLPTDRVATRPVTSAAYASAISVRCRGGRES